MEISHSNCYSPVIEHFPPKVNYKIAKGACQFWGQVGQVYHSGETRVPEKDRSARFYWQIRKTCPYGWIIVHN